MKRTHFHSTLLIAAVGLLVTFSFSNCKKDKNDPDPDEQVCLLTHIVNDTTEVHYTYDAQNRVTRADEYGGGYTTYSYSADRIVGVRHDAGGSVTGQDIYDLNSDGYVEYVAQSDGDETDVYYDANGYVEEIITNFADGRQFDDEYVVVDGNIVSIRRETEDGDIVQWIYEYYPDSQNKGGYFNVLKNLFYGVEIVTVPFGNTSRNLVKKMTLIYNGTSLTPIEYEYEFRADGYVSKMSVGDDPGDQVTYDYDCQ